MKIQNAMKNYWDSTNLITSYVNHIYFRNGGNPGGLFSITTFLFTTLALEAHTYAVNVSMSIRTTN